MAAKKYCKRCKRNITILSISKQQKLHVHETIQKKGKVFTIKMISENFNLSLVESKILLNHINVKHNKCIRCSNMNLQGENIECPKCKSLNLNWDTN